MRYRIAIWSYLTFVAPTSGLILERSVEVGQVVGPGSGALFRLASGGDVEMQGVAAVLERTSLKLSRTSVTLCVPHREDALAGDAVRRRLQRLADALGRNAEVATFI